MDAFEVMLRGQVEVACGTLEEARRAGHDHEIHLHLARIQDLLELAERNDVDTSGWDLPELARADVA